jgi:hypothetical protein
MTSNNSTTTDNDIKEPVFLVTLDCNHTQALTASKLRKPARREPGTRVPMYVGIVIPVTGVTGSLQY